MGSREDDSYWNQKYDSGDSYCETCNDYHYWDGEDYVDSDVDEDFEPESEEDITE